MVVTVTPTLGEGTVVRWYLTEQEASKSGVAPAVSASRSGVLVNTFLHEVSEEVLATARQVHADLERNSHHDVSHLATHRRRGLFGPLEPIKP